MSKQENELKAQLNRNINEVFGEISERNLKWHVEKKRVERVRINLKKEQTIKRMELLGLSEIMAYYKFNDLEIKRSGAGLKIEFTI